MDDAKGSLLVRIARQVVEMHVKSGKAEIPKDVPAAFFERSGVFTTLHTYPGKELRGCIGFPEPMLPLIEALAESAIAACHDPRFPPLSEGELGKIVVEVSVLTRPREIKAEKPEEYLKKIEIGKDGLIIEKGHARGLLLPQVPVECGWDTDEYLEGLCMKAGLSRGAWREPGTKLFRFGSEIFSEERPAGNVSRG